MVAYSEKADGNTEFHQIMDFLTRSSIYYALTVSPIVSTSFVEQFWTTAKSRTVNNISYIDATVAGKPVTILKASIRSDLLFDDADGTDSLNNQAIFDNIQLMGEDQPQTQTDPSPRPSPSIAIPDSNLEGSGGNHGGQSSNDASLSGNEDGLTLQSVYDLCVSLCKQVTAQAKEIQALKAQVKKLKKGVKPLITHHKAWMKTRLERKTSLKKKGVHKEYVSKQGRKYVKSFKGESSAHKDLAFDDLDDIVDDTLDYMETEDAQDEGRISSVVLEEKENVDKEVSTEAPVRTVKPNEGTDKKNKGNDKQDGGTDSTKVSTDRQGEGTIDQNEGKSATQTAPTTTSTPTSTPTPTMFGDVRPLHKSILTLRPLTKIDPKDKGKKRIEEVDEFDTESKGITEAEKKFKQLANDEEMARKVQEEWEAKEEKKRLAEEEDTTKVHAKQEATEQGTKKRKSGHVKMITRKRPRPRPNDDSDDEHRKCLRIITFESTIDSEIIETKSFIARLHKVSFPDGNYLVIYRVNGHFRAFTYLTEVLHIFDRQDLFHLNDLVMK
ncbi:hypothetical protein Tco_0260285 [Tanacetum coccineum]